MMLWDLRHEDTESLRSHASDKRVLALFSWTAHPGSMGRINLQKVAGLYDYATIFLACSCNLEINLRVALPERQD